MRKIKGNMSDLEERVLVALYALSCHTYGTHWKLPLVNGGGVGEMLGGQWGSYRHKVMLSLQKLGWVTCTKIQDRGTRAWFYQLTQSGYSLLNERARKALLILPDNQETLF